MGEIQQLPREIQLLEQAAAFLAECQDLDEVKSLRDKAEALRLYSKQQQNGQRAQNAAADIKVRAERRIGELSKAIPQAIQSRSRKAGVSNTVLPTSKGAVLENAGIDKITASRCEAIAAIPKEEFEEVVSKAKETNRELTSRELQKKGQSHQRKEQQMKRIRTVDNATDDAAIRQSWEIVHGHCVTVMGHPRFWTGSYEAQQTPAIKDVRLIFADPPYNEGIPYGDHYDDDLDPDDYRENAGYWLDCCHEALASDGSLWILINHEWAWALCADAEDRGFHLRQWLTWYESFGVNCTKKFNRCSRALLWLVKDPKRFVFNTEAVTRPSDRQVIYGDNRANPDGKLWDDVWGLNPPIPRLVGTAKERIPEFPTQLPLALLRPIVACASDRGDLVVDPFSGSGTTGAACVELDRRFIGIELSPRFVELSRLRLTSHPRKEIHAQSR